MSSQNLNGKHISDSPEERFKKGNMTGVDSLSVYKRDMGLIDLLTLEQEIELTTKLATDRDKWLLTLLENTSVQTSLIRRWHLILTEQEQLDPIDRTDEKSNIRHLKEFNHA